MCQRGKQEEEEEGEACLSVGLQGVNTFEIVCTSTTGGGNLVRPGRSASSRVVIAIVKGKTSIVVSILLIAVKVFEGLELLDERLILIFKDGDAIF